MFDDTRVTVRITIGRAGIERIPELEGLYCALHDHHAAIAPTLAGVPARDRGDSWRRRRSLYRSWLSAPGAFVATAEEDGDVVGYAVVSPGDGFQAWASAERVADVHDLVVAPDRRGRGVGAALMEAVEQQLAAAGFRELRIRVVDANDGALRFYRSRGMEPVSRTLLKRLDGSGAAEA
jgi:ribosomal protein S18 acetylase RimI-like enzyme